MKEPVRIADFGAVLKIRRAGGMPQDQAQGIVFIGWQPEGMIGVGSTKLFLKDQGAGEVTIKEEPRGHKQKS